MDERKPNIFEQAFQVNEAKRRRDESVQKASIMLAWTLMGCLSICTFAATIWFVAWLWP